MPTIQIPARPRSSDALFDVWTACSVANADGGFDPAEWQAIVRICDLLSLDPADFDVSPTAQASP